MPLVGVEGDHTDLVGRARSLGWHMAQPESWDAGEAGEDVKDEATVLAESALESAPRIFR